MKSRLLLALAVFCSFTPVLLAQSPLRITAQVGSASFTVPEGGMLPVQSDGRDTNVLLSLTNVSTTSVQLDQITLTGNGWIIVTQPALPVTLQANSTAFAALRFSPINGTRSSTAQLAVRTTQGTQSRTFTATLVGTAPELTYFLVTSTGRTQISSGSRISFGLTRVGSSQTVSLAVVNSGGAQAMINSATVTGRDFSAAFTAPAGVAPNQELSIPVTFNPQARGASTGTFTLDAGLSPITFALDGTGAAPEYIVAYALRTNGNVLPLTNGGRLVFEATPATATAQAEVIIGNQGNGPGSIRSVSVSGTGFRLSGLPLLPTNVNPGEVVRFTVLFNPRELGSYTGTLRIELDDRTINATIEGTTSSPDFSLAYIDPTTKNVIAIAQNGAVAFPATQINGNVLYTIILRNQGAGTGFVNAISVTGDGFQLTDMPLFPVTLEPARELRFGLRFAPQQREVQTGTLAVSTSISSLTYPLTGSGIGGQFLYETSLNGDPPVGIAPGGELAFSTSVGQTTTRTVRITNVGNSEAEVAAIAVSGVGFQLSNVPFLPMTLPVNGSQTFSVNFVPTQPGSSRGRLRVGDHSFDLAGSGIAPRLEFAYANDAGSTTVAEGGTIILPAARVGETTRVDLSIRNTGTSSAAISVIDISPVNTAFALESTPPLPRSLEPGASLNVGLLFVPNNVGAATATLRVNNSGFILSGSGQQPVPLPNQRITGPTGAQEPMRQVGVGLVLDRPYPLPLRGTLRLAFLSDVFSENRAVQFATGGRTVNFTLPANSTQALFENGSTEIRLQTGSVAGTIQVTPTFATTAGLDLTPADPGSLSMTIGRLAPRLGSLAVTGRTATSLALMVTGYSTTRTLRTVQVQLAPRSDVSFTTTSLTLNVESSAVAWFQSVESQGFGGTFSMVIPLAFSRNGSTEDLISYIRSITITVANEVGTSNTVEIAP